MIASLLIANRGEIACRIIRTARRLGIRTVAIFSEADASALHVRMADEAIAIGPAQARESYLAGDRIIAAARRSGAEAIHPGYGFLSENAEFAEAVVAVGLVWVGPGPASIRAMGSKDGAKRLMQEAGVPTTPGYLGEDQAPERLCREADAIGYPMLIKAVAGGGGKGMRKVDRPEDFVDALLSCRREAISSFGDDHVLIEKYVAHPRHIEVQVFGDRHGHVVHLFERDCSLQRRHQKVIEEAPAPGMSDEVREAICGAAVKAAKAVDYVGAGTVEFIADGSEGLRADRVWFMEMNTRLQVEHPVTEEISGVDLVEWQLRVASGEVLPMTQDDLRIEGHSVEARLYAEDPAKGFLPSVGRLDRFEIAGVRIETGVEPGDAISPFYDPMIAKLIASGRDREDAFARLAEAIGTAAIGPLTTNAGFLHRLLSDGNVRAGSVDTELIARAGKALTDRPPPSAATLRLAAAALAGRSGNDPWQAPSGFRLNACSDREVRLIDQTHARYAIDIVDPVRADSPAEIELFEGGERYLLRLARTDATAGATAGTGAVLAPMPGKIVAVDVEQGAQVTRGQKLASLEAMKMEQALLAPFDGVVEELQVAVGDQVTEGTLLVRVEPRE